MSLSSICCVEARAGPRPAILRRVSLKEYWKKRDFAITPEPKGTEKKSSSELRFVVQKHAASHLHYDFRLEIGGVMVSWSVPKGPSLDPEIKRLAMQTEDHPLDYADFEGVIPQGEYGGGTVVIWDQGTWRPLEDPVRAMKKGKMSFVLEGEKLTGEWAIWRTRGRTERDANRSWLLRKKDDDAAQPGSDIAAERPESVTTGRTIEQVAKDADRVWRSNRQEKKTKTVRSKIAARVAKAAREASGTELEGVRISSPDRVVYPNDEITKLQIAEYYQTVSEWMLPHVVDRPLTLVRCTKVGQDCVFMKHGKVWGPNVLRRVNIREKLKIGEYLVVDDAAGLVALAQLGIIEIHTWNSHTVDLERPDRLVFDLDPDPKLPWKNVIEAAKEVHERLEAIGLETFVKTTGGKGLHVVAPLTPSASWDECLAFAQAVAILMEREAPSKFTTNMSKLKRRGKIFIDVLRNSRGNTSVAAYSLRAREGATVSIPLRWSELDKIKPAEHTLFTVPGKLKRRKRDPWEGYDDVEQSIKSGVARKLIRAAGTAA